MSSDDLIRVDQDVRFKTIADHTFYFTRNQTLQNVTVIDQNLGFSKQDKAFAINCTTFDVISTEIFDWFELTNYLTRFRPTATVSASVTFNVSVADLGEPRTVMGETSYKIGRAHV